MAELPIFPLPQLVMLPGETIPLHVFEPRYRALVKHSLARQRVFGMATLRPGLEAEYEGCPAVFPEVAVGVVLHCEEMPDGRKHLLLQNIARAKIIEEYPLKREFREARCAEVVDAPESVSLDGLRALVAQLGRHFPGSQAELGKLLAFDGRFLVDTLASRLLKGVDARLAYVRSVRLSERARMVEAELAALIPMEGVAEA